MMHFGVAGDAYELPLLIFSDIDGAHEFGI
jgi:hypothetical protein